MSAHIDASMSTLERLAAMLAAKFNVDAARVSLEQPLEQLGIDSLGLVELLFFIEDEFNLKLPTNPPAFATVGDAVRYIDDRLAVQSTSPADTAPAAHAPISAVDRPASSASATTPPEADT